MCITTEVIEMSKISKDDLNRFLQEYKHQATVFHTQEWMRTLQDAFGYEPKYLVAQIQDESFFSIMPFMIDTRYGIKNYLSMPFDTYGGAVGDPSAIPALFHDFMELPGIGMRQITDYRRQESTNIDIPRIRTSTELLDLTKSLDDLCNGMEQKNRKHIKAAWKAEVMCREAKTKDDLHLVKKLLIPRIGVRGGIPVELSEEIFHHMIPAGLCTPYLTRVEGIPVCASVFFVYGDMAMYWAMALHKEGRVFHAHYQLMWQVIQDFKLKGIKTLNLGATPDTTDTVLPWKRSWGTKTHRYIRYQKIPMALHPILKIKEIIHG